MLFMCLNKIGVHRRSFL